MTDVDKLKHANKTTIYIDKNDDTNEPDYETNKPHRETSVTFYQKGKSPDEKPQFTTEVRKFTFKQRVYPSKKHDKRDKRRRSSDYKDDDDDNEGGEHEEDLNPEGLLDAENIYGFRVKLFGLLMMMVGATIGVYFLVAESIDSNDINRLQEIEGWYFLGGACAIMIFINSFVVCHENGRMLAINFGAICLTIPCVVTIVVVATVMAGSEIFLYALYSNAGFAILSFGLAVGSFHFPRFGYLGIADICVVVSCGVLYVLEGPNLTTFNCILFFLEIVFWSLGVVLEAHIILSPHSSNFSINDWGHGAYLMYTSILSVCVKYYQILGTLDLD